MKRITKLFSFTMILFIALAMSVSAKGQDDSKKEVSVKENMSQVELTGEIVIYTTPEEFTEKTGMTLPSFNEAPELKELVDSKKLDPVEKRIGTSPLIVQPTESIGTYGGIMRGAATTPVSEGHDLDTIREQKLFSYLPDLSTVYPNIAKSVDFSNGNKTMIIHLREGMRWSDGVNFTANDIVFWYEDFFLNKELNPYPPAFWIAGGEPVKIKKIDDYTVQFDFAVPTPTIMAKLAKSSRNDDPIFPAHYIKQFHIKYNKNIEAEAKEAGFESWTEYFLNRSTREHGGQEQVNPDIPVLTPWVWNNTDTSGNRFFVRNPYYWKVDTEGNQLPYVNELHRIVVQNTDSKTIGVINGDFSVAAKDLNLGDFPMIKENEEKGDYNAFLGTGVKGSYLVFGFNATWAKDPVLAEAMGDVRFRQAMSLALNREELNEAVFLGQGIPRQLAPIPQTSYYEPWMDSYYAEYDVEKANQLLDEMGLKWDSKNEYRLRSDGKAFTIPHDYWRWSDNIAKAVELTTDYWKAIGVKMDVKEIEPGLFFERRAGNDLPLATWGGDYQTEITLYVDSQWSEPPWFCNVNTPWELWNESKGAEGIKPPEDMIELFDWNSQRMQEVMGSEKYLELSAKIATRNLESLYQIGTVGLVPNTVVFDNALGNTPKSGVFTSDSNFFLTYVGETFYFKK